MKIVKFINFSDEDFVGKWDGKSTKFPAHSSRYLTDGLAYHFAKHLVNRELTKKGDFASTSPKNPQDVPSFMELWNKAIVLDDHQNDMDEFDANIADNGASKQHVEEDPKMAAKRGGSVTLAGPADPDLKDPTDEDSFEGKKADETNPAQS